MDVHEGYQMPYMWGDAGSPVELTPRQVELLKEHIAEHGPNNDLLPNYTPPRQEVVYTNEG